MRVAHRALYGGLLSATLAFGWSAEAHKGITSRFTYHKEVYPVFLNRCGRCHIEGGVGPMSLLKYEEAFPWAESLRTELLEAGSGDPHDFVKAAHREISARELDIVLDWATGGTPEGDKSRAPAPVALQNEWARGEPGLRVPLTAPFQLAADVMETSHEFVLPLTVSGARLVNAVDLLPGNPSIVRDAVISVRTKDGAPETLVTWIPRQNPAAIVVKPAIRIVPGAEIIARIHYKKTWKLEGQALTDRSIVGLYFND